MAVELHFSPQMKNTDRGCFISKQRGEYLKLKGTEDRLCGLVVRVLGYRSRGPGFDFRRYQIFWEVVDLERVHSASWG
jgi:hypothetical protein